MPRDSARWPKTLKANLPQPDLLSDSPSSPSKPLAYKSISAPEVRTIVHSEVQRSESIRKGHQKHRPSNASSHRPSNSRSELARKRSVGAESVVSKSELASPAKVIKTNAQNSFGKPSKARSNDHNPLNLQHVGAAESLKHRSTKRNIKKRPSISDPSDAAVYKLPNIKELAISKGLRPRQMYWSGECDPTPATSISSETIYSSITSGGETLIIKQLHAEKVSEQQLAAEIKVIYNGLSKSEAKCIQEVHKLMDQVQLEQSEHYNGGKQKRDKVYWRPLISMHSGLLQEHHDFFFASQHPSATRPLRELADKYSMAARMWKYGIHGLLELLRYCLPESIEWMLEFIYIAYSMITLLYETVVVFKATWIECMGDLARYRMAIEEDDMSIRDIWIGVARFWYVQASELDPGVGRLFHHRAVLARSYLLEQVALYCLSLTTIQPFLGTNDSIHNIFSIVSSRPESLKYRCSTTDIGFIRCHGLAYTSPGSPDTQKTIVDFLREMEDRIKESPMQWKREGVFYALINISSIFKYGATDATFKLLFEAQDPSSARDRKTGIWPALWLPDGVELKGGGRKLPQHFGWQWLLTWGMLRLATGSTELCTVPYVHILLMFVHELFKTTFDGKLLGPRYLEKDLEWGRLAEYLNNLLKGMPERVVLSQDSPPTTLSSGKRSLRDRMVVPEDFMINGQIWARSCYTVKHFETSDYSSDEHDLMWNSKEFDNTRVYRLVDLCKDIAPSRLQYFENDNYFYTVDVR